MNKKLLVSFLFLGFISFTAIAQRDYIGDADYAFSQKRYYEAIALYKTAYSKIKNDKGQKARLLFRTAECYRLVNNTPEAEVWFDKVIKTNYPDPVVYLHYAAMLKANQKYEDAIIQYNIYKEKVPGDPRGDYGIQNCELAKKWIENPSRFEVENEKRFNSKDDDFCPKYADPKLKSVIFTSTREGALGKGTDAWTGQNFSDIYTAEQDRKGAWSTPMPIGVPINSDVNEGCACLNPKGDELYFTRCQQAKGQKLGCKIYYTKKQGKDWEEPKAFELAADSFTVGHPAISPNELELYFASDMSGGIGGRDIWVMKRASKKDEWSKPVNVGAPVNTPGDELFPYVREDGLLYFSSNYLPGMGGLDIYKSKREGDKWSDPENLLSPLNSPGDDFAIVFQGKEEKGFLTSNRTGVKESGEDMGKGKGGDDIWSFYLPPLIFTLQGSIVDDTTKEPLAGVLVQLVRQNDGFSVSDTTDEKGFYKFDKSVILPNSSFMLVFNKDGYFAKKGQESTVGLERSKALVYDESLAKIPQASIELPEILYDLGRWELKEEYQTSLDGLIQTLNDNPKIVVELSSHTDSRPIPMTNTTLSQRRAESAVNYLVEKGISGDRMVPKGYGETKPKVLTKDIVKDAIKFKKGTVLTDAFINSLKTVKEREAAHALNRRTEFRVLRTDYVPKSGGNTAAPTIELIEEPKTDTPAPTE